MTFRTSFAAILILSSASGCNAQAEGMGGERYRIPADNLLRNTFAGQYVEFVYGSVAPWHDEIGLLFDTQEVGRTIPGFHTQTPGYMGIVNASPSAVIGPIDPNSNFGELLAENVARLETKKPLAPFGGSEFFWPSDSMSMFSLSAAGGKWHRDDLFPPACRTANTQGGGTYHSCTFRLRRDGFDLSFHLNGVNVAYADEYADFVLAKLESWRIKD